MVFVNMLTDDGKEWGDKLRDMCVHVYNMYVF